MIVLKTPDEIEMMAQAAKIVAGAHHVLKKRGQAWHYDLVS